MDEKQIEIRIQTMYKRNDIVSDGLDIHTPFELCREILDQLDDLSNKSILVISNIEWIKELQVRGVNGRDVTYISPCINKCKIAEILLPGCQCRKINDWKDFLEGKDNDMKFDVVIGNPPYQNSHKKDSQAKRKVGNKLWYQFIFKSEQCLKKDGYLMLVTPNQWMSGGVNQRKGSIGVLKDIFSKKQLVRAEVDGITSKYFNGIGIGIGWWVLKNSPITDETVFSFDDDEIRVNLSGCDVLSPIPNKYSFNIAKKVLGNNEKFKSYYFNSQSKPGEFNETEVETSVNKYPHWIMGSDNTDNLVIRYFPSKRNKKVDYKKVLFPMSTRYWQPYYCDKNTNVATLGQALQLKELDTKEGCYSVFYSKLFKYLCFNMQININGFMKTSIVKALPYLDMSKIWTDEELYKHFNLTQGEIDYVENSVK